MVKCKRVTRRVKIMNERKETHFKSLTEFVKESKRGVPEGTIQDQNGSPGKLEGYKKIFQSKKKKRTWHEVLFLPLP